MRGMDTYALDQFVDVFSGLIVKLAYFHKALGKDSN
jgi:hypothetical protein